MSFNTILEAEKEADKLIESTKEKAKQQIAEALSEQTNTIEKLKSNIDNRFEEEKTTFVSKLNETIKVEKTRSEAELEKYVQTVEKNKAVAVKQILTNFK